MKIQTVYWMVFVLTVLVYGTMLVWSVPIITADLSGLLIFDARPLGYSFEEAKAFLAALPPEANQFYQTVQRALDTAFPVLEALSFGGAIFLLLPSSMGIKRVFIALLVLPGSIFDLMENASVAALLRAGDTGITPDMVMQASLLTQLKFAFVAVSLLILIIVLVAWFWHQWRS